MIIDIQPDALRISHTDCPRLDWEALACGKLVVLRERATGVRTLPMTYGAARRFLEAVDQRNQVPDGRKG